MAIEVPLTKDGDMPEMHEDRLRRKAKQQGYRVQKARSIRWEGTDWTPPYRLIDLDTGYPIWPGFDSVADAETWLNS